MSRCFGVRSRHLPPILLEHKGTSGCSRRIPTLNEVLPGGWPSLSFSLDSSPRADDTTVVNSPWGETLRADHVVAVREFPR